MKKPQPVKIKPKVDRVVSFRIEGAVIDLLVSKGIDPKASAREYLREIAKDVLTATDAPAPKLGE